MLAVNIGLMHLIRVALLLAHSKGGRFVGVEEIGGQEWLGMPRKKGRNS